MPKQKVEVDRSATIDHEVEIEARRIVEQRHKEDEDERYKFYHAEFRPSAHLKSLSGFFDTGELRYSHAGKNVHVKFKLITQDEWEDIQRRLDRLEGK